VQCNADADCANVTGRTFCNTTTHACVSCVGASCTGKDLTCGTSTCTNGDSCCYTPGFGPGAQPTYTCSATCGQTSVTIGCEGNASCGATQLCCGTPNAGVGGIVTSYTCLATCGANDTPIACTASSQCGTNKVCCGTVTGGGPIGRVSDLSCADTCTGTGKYTICMTDKDCPQATPTCAASTLLPGTGYCQ
jgi:hypothetical protein